MYRQLGANKSHCFVETLNGVVGRKPNSILNGLYSISPKTSIHVIHCFKKTLNTLQQIDRELQQF